MVRLSGRVSSGVPGSEFQDGLATDAGVYLAGETDGSLPGQFSAGFEDAFVRKFDLSGNILWTCSSEPRTLMDC